MEWPRKYYRYGQDTDEKYDIVVHARAETKYGQETRNWPTFRFKKLLEGYTPVKVCSVGTRAEHIPNSIDLRNIPLKQLCDVLHSAKVCIGPSSGVMHLAHLCGCPIITWTDSKKQKAINTTNKKRYTSLWRAWDTPVVVIDTGWQPEIKEVAAELKRFV
jgi:ADP-heptose:LPS heptosyltransferase